MVCIQETGHEGPHSDGEGAGFGRSEVAKTIPTTAVHDSDIRIDRVSGEALEDGCHADVAASPFTVRQEVPRPDSACSYSGP
ncbi:hypothetical protein GCM10023168_19380 [Fodinibacter luteus]|uniref:Uncharacterized protein n=1 Tax=Fodinibacter luteus TaxID=552064 RepID=A0ABP8KGF7_9MICO